MDSAGNAYVILLLQFFLVPWQFARRESHPVWGSHRSEGLGVGMSERRHRAIFRWPRSTLVREPTWEQQPENSDIQKATVAYENSDLVLLPGQ